MRVEQLALFDVNEVEQVKVKKQTCLTVGDFSKVLCTNGFNVGQVKLFKKLREWKMLNKENMPYQEYIDRGYFKLIKEMYKRRSNITYTFLKVLVTPAGQTYIEERLLNERACDRS